ncbi:MAG TPA: hypothetical protein VKP59_06295 [Candidatus Thermoplasmatota archaeon]|nr:hypothetical protein [Candidatus Thermoplasmatota archaeon]
MNEITQCEKCQKPVSTAQRIYSSIYQGYICLSCYHNQFPKIPPTKKPLLIAGYHNHVHLLEKAN